MKCAYRKIVYYYPEEKDIFYNIIPARHVEAFEDCYGKECPFYDSNGKCKKAYAEVHKGSV